MSDRNELIGKRYSKLFKDGNYTASEIAESFLEDGYVNDEAIAAFYDILEPEAPVYRQGAIETMRLDSGDAKAAIRRQYLSKLVERMKVTPSAGGDKVITHKSIKEALGGKAADTHSRIMGADTLEVFRDMERMMEISKPLEEVLQKGGAGTGVIRGLFGVGMYSSYAGRIGEALMGQRAGRDINTAMLAVGLGVLASQDKYQYFRQKRPDLPEYKRAMEGVEWILAPGRRAVITAEEQDELNKILYP